MRIRDCPVHLHPLAQGAASRPAGFRPASTSGGGGGGGVPRSCCRIHCPRFTGDVRLGFDVSVRTLAWVSTPPRRRSDRPLVGTRRPNALDAVMTRQRLVDEGVVGVEQLQHAAIVPQDVREVLLRLLRASSPQLVVEAGEEVLVRCHPPQLAELQPLAGEVLDQCFGPGVLQHPDDLAAKIRPQGPLAWPRATARRRACCSRGNRRAGWPIRTRSMGGLRASPPARPGTGTAARRAPWSARAGWRVRSSRRGHGPAERPRGLARPRCRRRAVERPARRTE